MLRTIHETIKPENLGNYLQHSAEPVHDKIEGVGIFVGRGVTSVGSSIESRLSTGEQRQLNEKIKQRASGLKAFSSSAYEMAEKSVKNTTKFISTRVSKPASSEAPINRWKVLAYGTMAFAEGVYDGFIDGASHVGQRLGDSTSEIIVKKFGDEAGQVSRDLNETIGNGYSLVFRAFKTGVKKGFNPEGEGENEGEIKENGECSGSSAVNMETHESGEILQNEINKEQ